MAHMSVLQDFKVSVLFCEPKVARTCPKKTSL